MTTQEAIDALVAYNPKVAYILGQNNAYGLSDLAPTTQTTDYILTWWLDRKEPITNQITGFDLVALVDVARAQIPLAATLPSANAPH